MVNTLFPFLTFSSHAMFIERFGIFPLDIATLETKWKGTPGLLARMADSSKARKIPHFRDDGLFVAWPKKRGMLRSVRPLSQCCRRRNGDMPLCSCTWIISSSFFFFFFLILTYCIVDTLHHLSATISDSSETRNIKSCGKLSPWNKLFTDIDCDLQNLHLFEFNSKLWNKHAIGLCPFPP